MALKSFISSVKNSYKLAKLSRHPSFRLKIQIFKILLKLHLKRDAQPSKDKLITEYLFGFKVSAFSYEQILSQFQEIVLKLQYHFVSPQPSPKIIDGGANIGFTVLLFKLLYPRSLIYAFEPDPEMFKVLEKNIKQNKIRNVRTFNACLSANDGTINFFPHQDPLLGSIFPQEGSTNKIEVNALKLSDILATESFDVVKLDVEGAERQVIRDLEETKTLDKVSLYIVACHESYQQGIREEVTQVFMNNGFNITTRHPHYNDQGQNVVLSFHKI